jgi:hypothetical protein
MSDLKELLDRGIQGFEPVENWFKGTQQHLRRRQRNRRILSGVLAVIIAAGTGGGLWAALEHRSPTVIRPVPLGNLEGRIRSLQSTYDSLTVSLRDAQAQVTSAERNFYRYYELFFIPGPVNSGGAINSAVTAAKAQVDQATGAVHAIELKLQGVLGQIDPLIAQWAKAGHDPAGSVLVLRRLPIPDAIRAVVTDQGLYVLQGTSSGYRISLADPITGEILRSVEVDGSGGAGDFVVAFGSVWVATNYFPSGVQHSNVGIDRLDDLTLARQAHIASPSGFEVIRATGNAVWALETNISEVDPATNSITGTLPLPLTPWSFDATADRLAVLAPSDGDQGTVLFEVDALDGQLLRTTRVAPAGGGTVSAASDSIVLVATQGVFPSDSRGPGPLPFLPAELVRVADGRVASAERIPSRMLSIVTTGDGSGWETGPYGPLQSFGSDGAVRAILTMRTNSSLSTDAAGQAYVATQSSILVATFQPII